jgi:hypothetical protein
MPTLQVFQVSSRIKCISLTLHTGKGFLLLVNFGAIQNDRRSVVKELAL